MGVVQRLSFGSFRDIVLFCEGAYRQRLLEILRMGGLAAKTNYKSHKRSQLSIICLSRSSAVYTNASLDVSNEAASSISTPLGCT